MPPAGYPAFLQYLQSGRVRKTEVRRLNNTLSSFRDFAKLERLSLKAIDVQEVLQDVARLISPQARQQGVQLEFLRAGQALPRVELDPGKIEQAVLNLVLNALEAMPEGGELTLGTEADGGNVRIVVRDSGQGIPPRFRTISSAPTFRPREAAPAWVWLWRRSWFASTTADSIFGPIQQARRSRSHCRCKGGTEAPAGHEQRSLSHLDR